MLVYPIKARVRSQHVAALAAELMSYHGPYPGRSRTHKGTDHWIASAYVWDVDQAERILSSAGAQGHAARFGFEPHVFEPPSAGKAEIEAFSAINRLILRGRLSVWHEQARELRGVESACWNGNAIQLNLEKWEGEG